MKPFPRQFCFWEAEGFEDETLPSGGFKNKTLTMAGLKSETLPRQWFEKVKPSQGCFW